MDTNVQTSSAASPSTHQPQPNADCVSAHLSQPEFPTRATSPGGLPAENGPSMAPNVQATGISEHADPQPDGNAALAGPTATSVAEDAVKRLEKSATRTAQELQVAIDAIANEKNSLEQTTLVGRLAALKIPGMTKSELEKQLRASTLAAAKAHEAQQAARQREILTATTIEPDLLITEVETFISDRLYLPPGAPLVLALWTINAWVFDAFDTVPYLVLESAAPGSGKNTTLEILQELTPNANLLVSPAAPHIFRLIDAAKPDPVTLLLDEVEDLAGHNPAADNLRAILNEGYKKGGKVPRCVGDDHDVQMFEVFCPKAFALLGGLKGALLSRCIVITMTKRPPQVIQKSTRANKRKAAASPIREKLEAYAVQKREVLIKAYDAEPEEGYWPDIRDREAELWTPLLLHAQLAGSDTERRAVGIAREFQASKVRVQANEANNLLQAEILEVLRDLREPRFLAADLLTRLEQKENWGSRLDDIPTPKGKATAIGKFLQKYRPRNHKREASGTSYDREELIRLIDAQQNPGATGTTGAITTVKAVHVG